MNVNAFGPILLTSQLLRKKKLQKKSSIVLIASISGVCMANTGEGPYAATKAALAGYTKTAAFELAAQGTRVNTICPGLVPTEILTLSNEMFSEDEVNDADFRSQRFLFTISGKHHDRLPQSTGSRSRRH